MSEEGRYNNTKHLYRERETAQLWANFLPPDAPLNKRTPLDCGCKQTASACMCHKTAIRLNTQQHTGFRSDRKILSVS